MTEQKKELSHAEANGVGWLESIKEMVAALECDYERLEELREERDGWEPAEVPDDYAVTVLGDDDPAECRSTCNTCGRSWDDGIVTSRTPTPGGRCPFEDWHGPTTWAEANPEEAEELAELEAASKIDGDEVDADTARQRIEESPLSIQVRYPWISPGATADMLKAGPDEFCILLTTGGPALRIIGDLDEHQQPCRVQLQHQDWGTPWTDAVTTTDDDEIILKWAGVFYFGA